MEVVSIDPRAALSGTPFANIIHLNDQDALKEAAIAVIRCLNELYVYFGATPPDARRLMATAVRLVRENKDLSALDWAALVTCVRQKSVPLQPDPERYAGSAPAEVVFHTGTVYANLSEALIDTWVGQYRMVKADARDSVRETKEELPPSGNLAFAKQVGEHFHALFQRWGCEDEKDPRTRNVYPTAHDNEQVAELLDKGVITADGLREAYKYLMRRGPLRGIPFRCWGHVWWNWGELVGEAQKAAAEPWIGDVSVEKMKSFDGEMADLQLLFQTAVDGIKARRKQKAEEKRAFHAYVDTTISNTERMLDELNERHESRLDTMADKHFQNN